MMKTVEVELKIGGISRYKEKIELSQPLTEYDDDTMQDDLDNQQSDDGSDSAASADDFLGEADSLILQNALNSFGYHLVVDGIIGSKTTKVFNEVVTVHGLEILKEAYKDFGDSKPTDHYRDYIEIAFSEMGTREWDPGSNPEVEKYHRVAGGVNWSDDIPWCGSFVGYCLKEAGYPLPNYPYRALSWLAYGLKAFVPVYGAIAVKKRRGGGHVGFVVGASENGLYVDILGGNQHDEVNVTRYRTEVFKAFRLPVGYTSDKVLKPYFEAEKMITES